MAIIIERTITINNDKATLDKPIYFYIGDGNITCLFTIKEKEKAARFGSIDNSSNIIQDNEDLDYGEAYIYKPNKEHATTARTQIVGDKLQVEFIFDNIDEYSEAGVHKLQIHLYDSESGARNRLTIPPVDINVLMPVGYDTNAAGEALVGYSLLDRAGEEVPVFDEEGNYNKTEWIKGDIITSNKLNKIEDALYEINAADDNFVTNEGLETALANKANAAHNHTANNITGLARVATSGSYNDLSNKPNMATYATKTELTGKANTTHTHNEYANATHTHNEYAASSHTHTGYATTAELINKADKGHTHDYLTQDSLTNYATKSYVDNQGFITSIPPAYITVSDLQNTLADKAYATINYVDVSIKNAGGFGGGGDSEGLDLTIYATKDQLQSGLATKANTEHTHAYLVNVPDKYATKDYVNEAIENANIGGGSINPEDLADYATKDEMAAALIGKADIIHTHDDLYATTSHTHDNYALKEDIPDVSDIEIPENISYFENDAGYATNADVNDAIAPINEALDDINEGLGDYAKKTDLDIYAKKTEIPTIPTKVSELTNDKGYITEDKVPTKVSDLSNDTGYITEDAISDCAKKTEIPTATSQLSNNSGYMTSTTITRIEIVDELPETEEPRVLYIVKA